MALMYFLVFVALSLVLVNAGPAAETEKDMKAMMAKCNETNPIDSAYLEHLNLTGSFPDENVRPAKCFMRCMFMETGLMDPEGKLVADKLKEALTKHDGPIATKVADVAMFVDMCIAKDADVACQCEKAYRFSKCLMTQHDMFGRLEVGEEEDGGGSTIKDTITGFLRDMGVTVLSILEVLNQFREVLASAFSG